MCGRFIQKTQPAEIAQAWRNATPEPELDFAPGGNMRPDAVCVIAARDPRDGTRRLGPMRWGLHAPWDTSGRPRLLINARGETLHTKPSFRSAWERRRCLVPMNGWLEWCGEGRTRRAVTIAREDDALFWVAGLWHPAGEGHTPRARFTVVTRPPHASLAAVHPRQPALVSEAHHDAWLDPAHTPANPLALTTDAEQASRWKVHDRG